MYAHTTVLSVIRGRDLYFTARILLFVSACLDTAKMNTSIWNVCSSPASTSEYKAEPCESDWLCVTPVAHIAPPTMFKIPIPLFTTPSIWKQSTA